MRRVLVLLAVLSGCLSGVAQSFSIPAGASTATIQGVINSAAAYNGSGNVTISVAAGVSSGLGQITFTCPHNPTSITGPSTGYPYVWSARPTAIWRGAGIDAQLMYWPSCSVQRGIFNMEIDGNQPSTGGGAIEVAAGTTGTTMMYDYFHGNEEVYPYPCNFANETTVMPNNQSYCYDDENARLITFDGSPNGTYTSQINTLVQYNILGNPVQNYPTNQATTDGVVHTVSTSLGDCVNVQQWTLGPAVTQSKGVWVKTNKGFDSTGGQCIGIGIQGGTTNMQILDNVIVNQEQGIKWFECGGTMTTICYQRGAVVARNDISGHHRMAQEAQQTPYDDGNVSNFHVYNNSVHNPKDPAFGSWGFSSPEGNYQNGAPRVNMDSNLMMADCGNAAFPLFCSQNASGPNFFEYWASNLGSDNYNLMQVGTHGGMHGGVSWGYGGYGGYSNCPAGAAPSSCWQANYNTCEGGALGSSGNPGECVVTEGETGTAAQVPQILGNVVNPSTSTHTSNTPTFSPASGTTFNGTLTVTLSVAQFSTTSGLPQGNMNVWYTTDGTAPAPKSGTSKFYTGPFSITSTTTLKAVGMWGGPTQPASYTAGFGFTPSAAVSATYSTSGTSITLTGVATSCPNVTLLVAGPTEQCTATASYSNGTSDDVTSATDAHGYGPAIWASSMSNHATISTAGVVTPLVAGGTNITATLGVLSSNTVSIDVVSTAMNQTLYGGQNLEDFTGNTYPGSTNDIYYVTGTATGGYTAGNCHMVLPGPVTAGKHYDCLLISAPSATTEATSPSCTGTFTTTSSSAPGLITIPLTGCPTLGASTAWWIATITDDPAYPIPMGFYDCGAVGACDNTVPTMGVGTYQGQYLSGLTYGSYSSLSSTFTGLNNNQPTQWIDLTPASPVLTGAYQDNTGSINTMVRGSGYQMHAFCRYSDGVIQQCDGTADLRGDMVTSWGTSYSPVITVSSSGLITAAGYGTATSTCMVGTISCAPWTWTITNVPATADNYQGMQVKNMSIY